MQNKVQLITYVDRLIDGGIDMLHKYLKQNLNGALGGVHLLPFFDPIDGSDAGFDPKDHKTVDPRLGDWEDVKSLGQDYDIMADIIVNHVSADSDEFQDLLLNKDKSQYKSFFLSKGSIFKGDISSEDLSKIYRPRPGSPFSVKRYADGTEEEFWTTFTPEQIDINVESELGYQYLVGILEKYAACGIKIIRLDAVGYAIKRLGTSCFMIPETFNFIDQFTGEAHSRGIEVLVEIHSHYAEQIKIAEKVDFVYDFALPPLILHAIYRRNGEYLQGWLDISPRNAITVLDTHDGIGVIDIGPESIGENRPGLIPDEEVDYMVEEIHQRSQGQSARATGNSASNLDLYQVNCTYYDALGKDDDLYILARAIQFYAPGIPQVYYMGLLAEPNDMALLETTNIGRNINRHYFSQSEAQESLDRPVVKRLIALMNYRNSCTAFDGSFQVKYEDSILKLTWVNGDMYSMLIVDFESLTFKIDERVNDQVETLRL